jgi:hypothetical protein
MSWEVEITNNVTINITISDRKNGKRGRSDKLILDYDRGENMKLKVLTITTTKKCGCPFKMKATVKR